MKILHTSDWHLGHVLYGYDRSAEQSAMLGRITDIAVAERPDALVVSGDIFHTASPSASVQRMYADAMVRLRGVCPDMAIVVTAGNHDSASRHEAFADLWELAGVHVVGAATPDDLDRHIVRVGDSGFVIALPYMSERHYREELPQRLCQRVSELNDSGLPVVMMAHTTVRGCDITGHDSATELCVGGIDYIDIERLGDGFDYLALGHIHRPQFVTGPRYNSARYSGTPLAVSFDETYQHTVSIVTISARGHVPKIREVAIETPRPLVNIPAAGFAPWEEVLERLHSLPDDSDAYVRLNVAVEVSAPANAIEQTREVIAGKRCRLCVINTHRKATAGPACPALSVSELRQRDPRQILQMYLDSIGVTFSDELQQLFDAATAAVNDDKRL